MKKVITFVGMDAHKVSIKLAVLLPDSTKPVEWETANEKSAVRRMVRKVQRLAAGGEIRFCYEAGPCGYALQRWIREAGAECVVVAPSLIPRKPGDRIKTDRRDARKLAELLRAGLLTEVHAPTVEDEAVRDLCRAREDALRFDSRFVPALRRLLDRNRPVRAADIMSVEGPRASPWTPIAALLPMLAEGAVDAVPVLEGEQITGIVTRTDLISALARTSVREA